MSAGPPYVTDGDCRALFPNQPVEVTGTNDTCVCKNTTFLNNNNNTCGMLSKIFHYL